MLQQFLRNRFGQSRGESGLMAGGRRGQGRGAGQGGGGGRGLRRGAGGGGDKPGSGPGGNCVCPKCGHKVPHMAGQRCIDLVCPECGTKMTRE